MSGPQDDLETPFPEKLELADKHLIISWNDGINQQLSIEHLRKICPCATCREKRMSQEEQPSNPLAILPSESAREIKLEGMRPVGAYGYALRFSDGHSTGIYTLALLRSLLTP